ncbi:DUF4132 domain-containing protein [Nocardiopsis ansamitocini]|nr:DUF4132 domain-containing protein [Nocardiopsis ansamitocini]
MSTTSPPTAELNWAEGPDGYSLALDGTTLVCRNAKGRRLKSVPKKVRGSAEAERLTSLAQFLERHERECRHSVESWLLGSLPVPAATLAQVWPDPTWQDLLANLFVLPAQGGEGGFLRGVDDNGRIGVVDLDAESTWLEADRVVLAHPVLIEDLDDVREFALELDITQRLPQLTREVHHKPSPIAPDATAVTDYGDAVFAEQRHAVGRAQRLGFAVRGGYAVCRVLEGGRSVQARYWIGADSPDYQTEAGSLIWVDADERPIRLTDVGPIAWSEGIRMAELVYAGRTINEQESQ